MTREDFLYACENEWLINLERDENNSIDVDATIEQAEFNRWCWMPSGEWMSLKVIYRILEDEWAFDD